MSSTLRTGLAALSLLTVLVLPHGLFAHPRLAPAGASALLPAALTAAPHTAALHASVPPLVKTTSLERAPNSEATLSRAPSTAALANRPSVCTRPGSAALASHGTMASTTSGRAGDVDA